MLCSDLEFEWGRSSGSPEFELGGFPSSRRAAESEAGFRFRTRRSVFRRRFGGREEPREGGCFGRSSLGVFLGGVSSFGPHSGSSRNLGVRSRNLCVMWSCGWSWGGVERGCASKATSERTRDGRETILGSPPGRPTLSGVSEFPWGRNPERADVSAEAPSGFSSFGGVFIRWELAKSGCPVAKSVCDVELRVVVGWGRKGVRFEGNFGTYPRRSRDHPGFPTGETDPFGGLGVPVG